MKTDIRREPLPTSDGDMIVVEYHERRKGHWTPHSIVTSTSTWDAVWSKRYGCTLVHMSGGGLLRSQHIVSRYVEATPPPCRIWAAEGVRLSRWRGFGLEYAPVTPRGLRRMGYERIPSPLGDPFDGCIHVEGHIEYCSICDDYLDDESNAPCDHLRWSEGACAMVGAGADAEYHNEIAKSVRALGLHLGPKLVADLRAELRSNDCYLLRFGTRLGDALYSLDIYGEHEDCEPAVAWLNTIGAGRKLARARKQTLAWVSAA